MLGQASPVAHLENISQKIDITRMKVNFSADREYARFRGPRSRYLFDLMVQNKISTF